MQAGDGVGKILLISELQQVEQDGLRPARAQMVDNLENLDHLFAAGSPARNASVSFILS